MTLTRSLRPPQNSDYPPTPEGGFDFYSDTQEYEQLIELGKTVDATVTAFRNDQPIVARMLNYMDFPTAMAEVIEMYDGKRDTNWNTVHKFNDLWVKYNTSDRITAHKVSTAQQVARAQALIELVSSVLPRIEHGHTRNMAERTIRECTEWIANPITPFSTPLAKFEAWASERRLANLKTDVSVRTIQETANDRVIELLKRLQEMEAAGRLPMEPGGWFRAFPETSNLYRNASASGFYRIHQNELHDLVREVEPLNISEMSVLLETLNREHGIALTVKAAYEVLNSDKEMKGTPLHEVLDIMVKNVVNRTTQHWLNTLPEYDGKPIDNDHLFFSVMIEGTEYPMLLDTVTGEYQTGSDIDLLSPISVLRPVPKLAYQGESRAIDAFVAHHFKTDAESKAFYEQCGISMFGSGITNLVFLHGSGGSGKDMLFSLMAATLGSSAVNIPVAALTSNDERGSLTALNSARFAYCAFESSETWGDDALDPATLKSITSGGVNTLSVRPKYGREAIQVRFKGSLWLYGNQVPNLAGIGDFEGMSRRFSIMPLTEPLPKDDQPPHGFSNWESAIRACAPVFGYRCLMAFLNWIKEGKVGESDVRRRIPNKWAERSRTELNRGGRTGYLSSMLIPSPGVGMSVIALHEIVMLTAKEFGAGRINRLGLSELLKTSAPPGSSWYEDMDRQTHELVNPEDFMRVHTDDNGVKLYPVIVDLDWMSERASVQVMVQVHAIVEQAHPGRNFLEEAKMHHTIEEGIRRIKVTNDTLRFG
jgi:hypothetical protein